MKGTDARHINLLINLPIEGLSLESSSTVLTDSDIKYLGPSACRQHTFSIWECKLPSTDSKHS